MARLLVCEKRLGAMGKDCTLTIVGKVLILLYLLSLHNTGKICWLREWDSNARIFVNTRSCNDLCEQPWLPIKNSSNDVYGEAELALSVAERHFYEQLLLADLSECLFCGSIKALQKSEIASWPLYFPRIQKFSAQASSCLGAVSLSRSTPCAPDRELPGSIVGTSSRHWEDGLLFLKK